MTEHQEAPGTITAHANTARRVGTMFAGNYQRLEIDAANLDAEVLFDGTAGELIIRNTGRIRITRVKTE